jgi:hypothetical protein
MRKKPKIATTYVREKKKFHFDPDVLRLPGGVYLDGSWQSEKYFAGIASIIRKEFTVKAPLKDRNEETAAQIAGCNSVSIHVRRGDYVSDPKTNRIHGFCGIDYYRKALDYVAERVSDLRVFVFSEEPDWALKNLQFNFPKTVIGHNPPVQGHEDLRLMSLCKHQVMANSTFSWWGAWLCVKPDPIIICPERWFLAYDFEPRDLLPERWIKI